MRGYETICILHPDLTEEQVKETTDEYSRILTDGDGEVHKSETWGLRKLAYKVKGNAKGHFVYLLYSSPPESVNELERILRISDKNIRYMTIKVDSVEEEAKARPQLLEDPTLTLQDG